MYTIKDALAAYAADEEDLFAKGFLAATGFVFDIEGFLDTVSQREERDLLRHFMLCYKTGWFALDYERIDSALKMPKEQVSHIVDCLLRDGLLYRREIFAGEVEFMINRWVGHVHLSGGKA